MNLGTEIFLSDEVWSQIFKHIKPKTFVKLRSVNVELMDLIEKLGAFRWKTLFFESLTLASWKNQLCEMYDPQLTNDEYDFQPDGFYKELIDFYFSWKNLGNAEEPKRVVLHSENYRMEKFSKCDLDGNYLACHSIANELCIIDENTLDLVAGPVTLPGLNVKAKKIIQIKIWRPQSFNNPQQRKFFVITQYYHKFSPAQSHTCISIWDVDDKVYRPLSGILEAICRQNQDRINVRRNFRSGNDIFIELEYHEERYIDIVKLIWDPEEKKIDGSIVLRIMNSFFVSVYHYLHDMYVENSKIMIVLGSKNNFYFSQTDIQNGSNEPRVISLSQCKQIFHFDERIECKAKIKIHNSYVVTAYSERDFCIALKTETQNEEYDFVTKSIQGVNTFLHISNCVIKFDVMFILTQEGSLIFYKFKNINHLIDIDLLTNQAMAIETGSEYSLVKLMMRNLIPYTLIICEKKDIILLTF